MNKTHDTAKALPNSPINLIVGGIHRAYTLTADDLFLHGYIDQDTRMAIGGGIGDLLQALRDNLLGAAPALGGTVVTAEDVDAMLTSKAVEESLETKAYRVRSAFYKAFNPPTFSDSMASIASAAYVLEVYAAYVIANFGDDSYFKLPYTDSDGVVTFAARIDWLPVKMQTEWVEKAARLQRRHAAVHGDTDKAGARHSANDSALLQQIHDAALQLGAECLKQTDGLGDGLLVYKEVDTGLYRWVTFSSSAFEDQDDEIVSKAALTADVERAELDRDYGPLLFGHDDSIKLGTCDFNMMDGPILIESGTFADAEVGKAFADSDEKIGVSIKFSHPFNEPDADGVYHHIKIKERSLLWPLPTASNRVAFLIGIGQEG